MVALVGFAEHAEDVYNSLAVLADGARPGHLPEDLPAELRRLRRAALLPGRRQRPRSLSVERRDARPHDLRGHLGAGAAGQRRGARRRRGDREHLGLAVPHGQGRRARADARSSAPATTSPTSSSATSSAARTSSSSTATASSSTRTASWSRAAPQFEEELIVCDIDPSTAQRARLRDARHRARRA